MTSTEHAAVIRQRQSPENAPVADRTGGTVRDLIAPTPAGAPAWNRRISSHERFDHDSIDGLGYDRERVAEDPSRRAAVDPNVYWTRKAQQIQLWEAGRA